MKLSVVGQGCLADTTRQCCEPHFTMVPLPYAELLWVCYDTPIGKDDVPDVEWVLEHVRKDLRLVQDGTVVLISSQLPVGTTARIQFEEKRLFVAYSPENIRVAHAIEDFQHQSRIIVGRADVRADDMFMTLLMPFTSKLILTTIETAEMAKHALNCYLGLCISFINEIARIAEVVGADAETIADALLLERRVSPSARLKPGKPFGGGHLARDIWVLSDIASTNKIHAPLITNIKESNDHIRAIEVMNRT